MVKVGNLKTQKGQMLSPERLDLLATTPSGVPFGLRVQKLSLSPHLEKKVLQEQGRLPGQLPDLARGATQLTATEEKELATEVLLLRHQFTEQVFRVRSFRQATLTIIQNIYLFKNRKIFFGTSSLKSSETERQEALELFSDNSKSRSLPLAKSFQHLLLARVWNRIINASSPTDFDQEQFSELQAVVEQLNTIRNIYMLLTGGLVRKLATQINDIYKESVTTEDAIQIGSFGIARAAYRYHPSSGVRFSTYASKWFFKEIQRQALQGRLIRLSSNTVEQYARAMRDHDKAHLDKVTKKIKHSTTSQEEGPELHAPPSSLQQWPLQTSLAQPEDKFEAKEQRTSLIQAVGRLLSEKSGDIIRRRFGLPPYEGKEQSVISISNRYGVTRSSIYQLEQAALLKLRHHFSKELV